MPNGFVRRIVRCWLDEIQPTVKSHNSGLFRGRLFRLPASGHENDPSRPIPPHPRGHPQRSSHDRPAVLPGWLTVEPRISPARQIRRRHLDVWICHERPPDSALHPPRAAQVNNRAVLAASAGRPRPTNFHLRHGSVPAGALPASSVELAPAPQLLRNVPYTPAVAPSA
jgi:hypothetical protein